MEQSNLTTQEEISLLKKKYDDLKQKYDQLKEKLGVDWGQIKDKMQVYGEGAEEVIDAMSRYIKENPQRASIIAGLIGLGIGFILGMLIRGNRE